jgi:hypothetical protein
MNIGAILVGIGLVFWVAAYVARPLFERRSGGNQGHAVEASTRAQLTTRREAIYALIRELDADFQTGKINDQDHQALRKGYVAEGVSVLKQLDALAGKDSRSALEAEIERRVLAVREARATVPAGGPETSPRFCTQCGHPADREDRFCARCGTSLKEAASP